MGSATVFPSGKIVVNRMSSRRIKSQEKVQIHVKVTVLADHSVNPRPLSELTFSTVSRVSLQNILHVFASTSTEEPRRYLL